MQIFVINIRLPHAACVHSPTDESWGGRHWALRTVPSGRAIAGSPCKAARPDIATQLSPALCWKDPSTICRCSGIVLRTA